MSIDLRPDHLSLVQEVLKTFVPVYRVIGFGSRVSGNAEETSDLDLCIMSDRRLSFETLAHLRYGFSESNLPFKVDVVDWSALGRCLEKQAARRECREAPYLPRRFHKSFVF